MLARHASILQPQSHALSTGHVGPRGHQSVAANEIALVRLNREAQSGLQGVNLFGELVAVKRHARLQPQRVASRQTHRTCAPGLALIENPLPDVDRRRGRGRSIRSRLRPCNRCG